MRPQRPPQSFFLWFLILTLVACGQKGNASEGQGVAASDAPVLHSVRPPVRPGIEVLLTDSLHLLQGKRVGLITNHSAMDRVGVHDIDLMAGATDFDLVALFSPEHGIRGEAEGGISIESQTDERSGLPIHSLYGETRKPTPAMLEGLDLLLYDIQDIGARYFTYVSTMARAMEAAGEAGIPFLVLDRPNPVGGVAVQGTVLDPDFSTFVGLYPVPMRHGMTSGELARMYVGEFGVQVDLTVIPVEGWTRGMTFEESNLPWVAPSPNMPSVESAIHYTGTCLFEGTPISVGRGTEMAFQVVGAPWLDPDSLARAMAAYAIPGVRIEPVSFTPERPGDGKFGGQESFGVRLTAVDPDYDATLATLALLIETRRMSGNEWEWRIAHFDRLAGTDRLREGLDSERSIQELRQGWDEDLAAFKQLRSRYLIY
jgi:uncharacterized protein YbbC (DUF1343 family)